MKLIALRHTIDVTPEVKRTGVEVGSNLIALEFTTVTGAATRIEMTFEEWHLLRRDVSGLMTGSDSSDILNRDQT